MAGSNPFSKAKDTYELVKKAKAIQKELKETEIEASSTDGTITVVFNGEQRMTSISIDESWLKPERQRDLEKSILNVTGQAISKAQAVAAEQMKKVAGDLNLPAGLGF
jgi:DNA-binding YbaB/EbfC family protein